MVSAVAARDNTRPTVGPPAPNIEAAGSILEEGVEREGGSRGVFEEGVVIGAVQSVAPSTLWRRDSKVFSRESPTFTALSSGLGAGNFGPKAHVTDLSPGEEGASPARRTGYPRSSARLSSAKKTPVLERAKLRKAALLEG